MELHPLIIPVMLFAGVVLTLFTRNPIYLVIALMFYLLTLIFKIQWFEIPL